MDDQPASAAPSKAGRPPKPGRKQVHVWVPDALVDLLKRDAAAQQVPLGDRLAEILASHYSRQEAMPKAS
jgi:hypothetical protein